MATLQSGRAIDNHKTVWRYNLKGANVAEAGEYVGRKTHVRMFNRLRYGYGGDADE